MGSLALSDPAATVNNLEAVTAQVFAYADFTAPEKRHL